MPEITLYSQRAVDVTEKTARLQSDRNVTMNVNDFVARLGGDAWGVMQFQVFNENRALFFYTSMISVNIMRDMDLNFGILPPPKFNEAQERYFTNFQGWFFGTVAIPITIDDTARTGHILEALTAESYYTLRPAYYDNMLRRKLTRDDESHEMLDIIFANRLYDIGHIFGWGGVDDFFVRLSEGRDTLTTFWEANEPRIMADLERTMRAFEDD
jgi:hypothetical protein